jgi:hypothetical protein
MKISKFELDRLVRAIHSFPELKYCAVGFQGNGQSILLSRGGSSTDPVAYCAVIIEQIFETDPVIIKDTQKWAIPPGRSPDGSPNPLIVTNRSKLGAELSGAGMQCGLAVVSVALMVGGAAAEVPSGGTSTFLIVVAWTGVVTSGLQCANQVVRIGMIAAHPDGSSLQELDSNAVYTAVSLIVDGIGLASGIAQLPNGAKNLWAIVKRLRSFSARGLTESSLRAMNRVQRMKVVSEIVEEASRIPEGRAAIITAAREAQVGARSIQRTTGLSVRNAERMVTVISDETIKRLQLTLLNILGVPASAGGSALPPSLVGGGSGSVNWVIHVVDTRPAHSI